MMDKVQILPNRKDIDTLIERHASKTLGELYRENVNPNVTDFELSVMKEEWVRRIVACSIWRNNYVGIVAQFAARTAQLRRVVVGICGVPRVTLWRWLSEAGIDQPRIKKEGQKDGKKG